MLLLTPGFITDTLGLLLFIPAIRDGAWRLLRSRVAFTVRTNASGGGPARRGDRRTIDLDSDDFSRTDRRELD